MCALKGGILAENRIQREFRERHLKVSEFARDNGIEPGALYPIISGKTHIGRISIDIFIKIADGLGMSIKELRYDLESDESESAGNAPQGYEMLSDEGKHVIDQQVEYQLYKESHS